MATLAHGELLFGYALGSVEGATAPWAETFIERYCEDEVWREEIGDLSLSRDTPWRLVWGNDCVRQGETEGSIFLTVEPSVQRSTYDSVVPDLIINDEWYARLLLGADAIGLVVDDLPQPSWWLTSSYG